MFNKLIFILLIPLTTFAEDSKLTAFNIDDATRLKAKAMITAEFAKMGPDKLKEIQTQLDQAAKELESTEGRFIKMGTQDDRKTLFLACLPTARLGLIINGIAGLCYDKNGVHIISGEFAQFAVGVDISAFIGVYRGPNDNISGKYHSTSAGAAVFLGAKGIKMDAFSGGSILLIGVSGGAYVDLPLATDRDYEDHLIKID